MEVFLNPDVYREFRNAFNETPLFMYDEEYKTCFNLFCAVTDRLESCIEYLNGHAETPKTEEDFLSFVMFSCMVLDAVKHVLKQLDIEKIDEINYFQDICLSKPLNIEKHKCPTDDKFFEYLRSIMFAHPFETNRPKFFMKHEIQFSPWVIANNPAMKLRGIKDGVGVRIYSNKFDEIKDLIFSFDVLKKYIKSQYLLLYLAIAKVKEIVSLKEIEWKKHKINRSLDYLDILKEIKDILKLRHEEYYDVETVIRYMGCKNTLKENLTSVERFKQGIIEIIPELCDAVDSLNYEMATEKLDYILHQRPWKMHSMANYQLEKIYCDLNETQIVSKREWALEQVELFSKEFAKKWVTIIPQEMSFDEIKLLVTVSCYLEKIEQEKEKQV
ncbi:hypothetical protein [uncultured Phascolarctobacterium sp.]|uniref:hypothetical protein n=1 Tax=uncultured Phascolarctobacterium sp. TaxID=512296 RepID=UPI0025D4C750|nr:hypothetical protein [uncultured Phascolarctobacterium sp.]